MYLKKVSHSAAFFYFNRTATTAAMSGANLLSMVTSGKSVPPPPPEASYADKQKCWCGKCMWICRDGTPHFCAKFQKCWFKKGKFTCDVCCAKDPEYKAKVRLTENEREYMVTCAKHKINYGEDGESGNHPAPPPEPVTLRSLLQYNSAQQDGDGGDQYYVCHDRDSAMQDGCYEADGRGASSHTPHHGASYDEPRPDRRVQVLEEEVDDLRMQMQTMMGDFEQQRQRMDDERQRMERDIDALMQRLDEANSFRNEAQRAVWRLHCTVYPLEDHGRLFQAW